MTYSVLLFDEKNNDTTPKFWYNFCVQYRETNSLEFMKLLRDNHHAKFYSHGLQRYLEFDSEEYYSMFVLRWS